MKLTHTRPRAQPNAITIAGAGDVRAAPAALTGVACVLKDARSLPNRPPPAPLVEEKKMRRVLGSGKGGEGEATQKSARPGATYFSAGSVSRARERRACRKVKKKKVSKHAHRRIARRLCLQLGRPAPASLAARCAAAAASASALALAAASILCFRRST